LRGVCEIRHDFALVDVTFSEKPPTRDCRWLYDDAGMLKTAWSKFTRVSLTLRTTFCFCTAPRARHTTFEFLYIFLTGQGKLGMDTPPHIKAERKRNALKQIGGTKGPGLKGLALTKQQKKRRRTLQMIAKGDIHSSASRANQIRLMQFFGENA